MRRSHVAWVLVFFFAVGAAARLGAIERKPLPDFTLTSLNGTTVPSAAIAREGTWLLVYVRGGCGSCDAVLNAIRNEEAPGLASRVVVIVGGASVEQAAAQAERFKHLADATWYIDPADDALAKLDVRGVPIVFGVRDRTIEWALAGVLSNSAELRSILTTWPRK